jgi:hypothetical protein
MTAYHVRVDENSGIPLAVVRRQARARDLSKLVPECCGLVWTAIRGLNLRGGRHVAIYWDDSIRLEVGVELDRPFSGVGEVVPSATPAGITASVMHLGPYPQLAAAHDAIHRWVKTSPYKLSGPRWEIYGHWQEEWNTDPSKIRTDVFYLLSQ